MPLGSMPSTQALCLAIHQSAVRGETRLPGPDIDAFLASERVRWQTRFLQSSLPDKPALFAANHFVRPPLHRGTHHPLHLLTTTRESIITTALITKEAGRLSDRPLAWFAKAQVRERLLGLPLPLQRLQRDLISVYGLVALAPDHTLSAMSQTRSLLRQGRNLGVYPEGEPHRTMGSWRVGFDRLLLFLQRSHADFQIVPVGIGSDHSTFHLTFGASMDPLGDPHQVADTLMNRIRALLPAER